MEATLPVVMRRTWVYPGTRSDSAINTMSGPDVRVRVHYSRVGILLVIVLLLDHERECDEPHHECEDNRSECGGPFNECVG